LAGSHPSTEVGHSDTLAAKLRAEEAKLLEAREALARASVPASPPPLPRAYSTAAVLAVLDHSAEAASKKPQKAKALLRAVVNGGS
jgi:hypothetical protein